MGMERMGHKRTKKQNDVERVWYYLKCDKIHVFPLGQSYLFEDKNGPFISLLEYDPLKLHHIYYVGDL